MTARPAQSGGAAWTGRQRIGSPAARIGAYGWYALIVLVLVYAINFVDRQIISILAQDIKRDLRLDDSQIGFLYGTAFAVFYALFGIPLGRLADSWYRGRLIAIGLAFWSGMTALSGFASSYGMLGIARIGVGIGEASASPAAYSMISDYFPKARRATALSIYSSGLYIGGGLSLPIGALVSSRWNHLHPDPATAPLHLAGWQAAFLAVGIPGLLLALWVLTLREPQRGAADGLPQPVVRARRLARLRRRARRHPAAADPARRGGEPHARQPTSSASPASPPRPRVSPGHRRRAQWVAYGIGAYAIFSWVLVLRRRDAPTWRLIWGTPTTIMLAVAFGSISFITYAVSFWAAPYALRTFYAGPAARRPLPRRRHCPRRGVADPRHRRRIAPQSA